MSHHSRLALAVALMLLALSLALLALALMWEPPRHPTVLLPVPAWASTPVGVCCTTPFANAMRVDRLRGPK